MTDPMAKAEITLPLNKVLENAGGELERLAAIAANIDDHIGDLLLHPELASKLSSELMQEEE